MQALKKTKLSHDVAQLPDRIVGRAEYLKDYFDRNVYEVLEDCFNPLVDELTASTAAGQIGAEGFSVVPSGTVQSQLEALKGLMDDAQWGIPDSCSTESLKDGAVTKEKLEETIQNRLEQISYEMECVTSAGGFSLSGAVSEQICSIYFKACDAYQKGDSLTVNGESYLLMMPNGKALPDAAWIADAVVVFQLNPETKTAFFNAGGADLSFITATAENIIEGYVGSDTEGEAVAGTNPGWITEAVTGTFTFASTYKGNNTFSLSWDKKPKAFILFACNSSNLANKKYFTQACESSGSNAQQRTCFWIDGFLQYHDPMFMSGASTYQYISLTEVTDTGLSGYCNSDSCNSSTTFYVYYELYY